MLTIKLLLLSYSIIPIASLLLTCGLLLIIRLQNINRINRSREPTRSFIRITIGFAIFFEKSCLNRYHALHELYLIHNVYTVHIKSYIIHIYRNIAVIIIIIIIIYCGSQLVTSICVKPSGIAVT